MRLSILSSGIGKRAVVPVIGFGGGKSRLTALPFRTESLRTLHFHNQPNIATFRVDVDPADTFAARFTTRARHGEVLAHAVSALLQRRNHSVFRIALGPRTPVSSRHRHRCIAQHLGFHSIERSSGGVSGIESTADRSDGNDQSLGVFAQGLKVEFLVQFACSHVYWMGDHCHATEFFRESHHTPKGVGDQCLAYTLPLM